MTNITFFIYNNLGKRELVKQRKITLMPISEPSNGEEVTNSKLWSHCGIFVVNLT